MNRAFLLQEGDEAPALVTVPEAPPGEGEVSIAVEACALNFADLLMIEGTYQETPPRPFAPGMEIAGRIAAIGPGVEGFAENETVLAFCGSGGLADRLTVAAGRVIRRPDALDPAHAAALPVAYGTSHLALTARGRLARGETLAVLGAGGGVGLTAVEIGARMGARVIAVARGRDKHDAARAAGAAETIEPTDALAADLKALGGVDVLYDPVGGEPAEQAARALRPLGRHLVIGFASGSPPRIRPNVALVKNVDVIGFYWGGYLSFDPAPLRESLSEIVALAAAGELKPRIGLRLPLERAAEGLQALRDRRVTGKVVIDLTSP